MLQSRSVSTLTTELIRRSHQHDVYKKSTGGLSMYIVNTPSDRTTSAEWADPLTCYGTLGNNQPRLHAQLAQVFLSQIQTFHLRRLTSVAISNERGSVCSASTRAHRPGSASAYRLLVSASSPLSYPMPRRFRHSRYFAVCRALVYPSAVFFLGRFFDHDQLSLRSCFAWSHRSLVSMCSRGPHPCRWIMPRAAV